MYISSTTATRFIFSPKCEPASQLSTKVANTVKEFIYEVLYEMPSRKCATPNPDLPYRTIKELVTETLGVH